MMAPYHHLTLAQVQPGMILSDQLLDLQGYLLLPQGTKLTASMLASVLRHGIESLPILVEAPLSGDDLAYALQQHRKRIARLFRKNDPDSDSDQATGLLRRYVEKFRLGGEIPE